MQLAADCLYLPRFLHSSDRLCKLIPIFIIYSYGIRTVYFLSNT